MPVSDDVLDELETRYLTDDNPLDLPHYLDLLGTMADPTRFAILTELNEAGNDGRSPAELADALDLNESSIRDHIDVLVEVGLANRWREANQNQPGTHLHCEISGYGLAAFDAFEELLAADRRAAEYFRSDS
ncbi:MULTISPECIES: helix-turn-helix domain-containing protein [Halobacterium]|uniref:winged helix-turn-helix domain-containing protein n=1 Tax=Halobacterium TaxID=2239 RepID=UPI00073E1441|nr:MULTISPECIES: helix-turn-helix domain-containing protein [Halobacterium]MCG1001900.1 helix-turn-helix domain-containing protein [Halobacterium noricense]